MSSVWEHLYPPPTRGMVGLKWLTQLVQNVNYVREKLERVTANGAQDVSTNWGVDNAAGSWASDTSAQAIVSLSLAYVSDVLAIAQATWMDGAAYPTSCKFRIYNVTDGVGGETIGFLGSDYASTRRNTLILARFANVAAGTKQFRIQASRETSGRVVNVLGRWLLVVGLSVAH